MAPKNTEYKFNLYAIVPIGKKENNFPVRKASGKPVGCPTANNGTCIWNHVVSMPNVVGSIVLKKIKKGITKLRT